MAFAIIFVNFIGNSVSLTSFLKYVLNVPKPWQSRKLFLK